MSLDQEHKSCHDEPFDMNNSKNFSIMTPVKHSATNQPMSPPPLQIGQPRSAPLESIPDFIQCNSLLAEPSKYDLQCILESLSRESKELGVCSGSYYDCLQSNNVVKDDRGQRFFHSIHSHKSTKVWQDRPKYSHENEIVYTRDFTPVKQLCLLMMLVLFTA